jgi:hypothetical protein
MKLYLALVHYPVFDKNGRRIASAVTTFDLHDLSRAARTYGARLLYVVTPLLDQQKLVGRVLDHWRVGYGARYNPNRKEALELIRVSPDLEETVRDVTEREGEAPVLIATDARRQNGHTLSYADARGLLHAQKPVLLLFGTAWGLDREVMDGVDYLLDPVEGGTGWNHLSVRGAAAIILDRLAGV